MSRSVTFNPNQETAMTLWIRYALAALVLLVPLTRGADAQAPGLVFPKSELWIVSGDKRHHFTIEFADNDERRMTGLMFQIGRAHV